MEYHHYLRPQYRRTRTDFLGQAAQILHIIGLPGLQKCKY
jgi:hypothetical protein